MSPSADDGALIITFPRVWTAEQRLEFTSARDVFPRGRVAVHGPHRRDGRRAPGGLRAVDGAPGPQGGPAGRGHPRVDGMSPTRGVRPFRSPALADSPRTASLRR